MKKTKEFPLNGVELSTNCHRKLRLTRLTCWSRLSFPSRRQVAVPVCLETMRTPTSSSFSITNVGTEKKTRSRHPSFVVSMTLRASWRSQAAWLQLEIKIRVELQDVRQKLELVWWTTEDYEEKRGFFPKNSPIQQKCQKIPYVSSLSEVRKGWICSKVIPRSGYKPVYDIKVMHWKEVSADSFTPGHKKTRLGCARRAAWILWV